MRVATFCLVVVLLCVCGVNAFAGPARLRHTLKTIEGYGDYKFGLVLKDHPKLLKGWGGPVPDPDRWQYLGGKRIQHYDRKGGEFQIGALAPKVVSQTIYVIDGRIEEHILTLDCKSYDTSETAARKEAEGLFDAFATKYDVRQRGRHFAAGYGRLDLIDQEGNRISVYWLATFFSVKYVSARFGSLSFKERDRAGK